MRQARGIVSRETLLRTLLLFLSRRRQLRKWMETSAAARRLSSRFIAGNTLDDAIRVSRRVNGEGIKITLDHLGENVASLEEAAAFRDVYCETLERLVHEGIDGNVSLKLTQFGMDFSEEACRANVEILVRRAAELGTFVRVDMESSEYTDRTLRLVTGLHAQYGAAGAVVQSYLYRSEADVRMLCERRIRVRLCKGAYLEPAEVAFQKKAEVDANFVRLMRVLLDHGEYPAIATHDAAMIAATRQYTVERRIARDRFEFQMLYGIRRDLQRALARDGYRLRLYVPFGRAWYPYFMRRLAERPANMLFIARNLFRS
jgi:proline dehydrogenase